MMNVYPRRNCCCSFPGSPWKTSEILWVFLKLAPSVHELLLKVGFDSVHVDEDFWLGRPGQERTAPESRFFFIYSAGVRRGLLDFCDSNIHDLSLLYRCSWENILTILFTIVIALRRWYYTIRMRDEWGSSWRAVRIKSVYNRICPILKLF